MAGIFPRKLIYSPAELGFDSVAVNFGTSVNGNWLDWRKLADFNAVELIFEEMAGAGATPFAIAIAVRDFNDQAWVNSETVETLVGSVTNNPRTQFYRMNHDGHGSAVGAGTTGSFVTGAVAKALIAPRLRFSVANQHGSINATIRMRAILHW